jgi:IS5 family transposase
VVFERFTAALAAAGFVAMSGQIHRCLDRRRAETAQHRRREARHQGRTDSGGVAQKPAKLRQKDRDARWTVKYTKAKPNQVGAPRVDLAVPAFGYKNHIGIDRPCRLIRRWTVTDAARHDVT